MKQLLLVLFAIALFCSAGFAQAPLTFPYQAVARDASGNLLANTAICVQLAIVDNNNTTWYGETQPVTTNYLGLFSVNVGSASMGINGNVN